MLEAAQREPALKARHAHPRACSVQPALERGGSFPGLPHGDIDSGLRRDSTSEFTAVKPLQSEHRNKKNMKRMRGMQSERHVLSSNQKNAFFDGWLKVRRCDVTVGLWASRRVSFQGSAPKRKEGGKDHRWRKRETLFPSSAI